MNPLFPYQIVADELRARLRRGQYGGKRLPSERELMAEFHVQRATIRRALDVLQDEGTLVRTATGARYAAAPQEPNGAAGSLALVVRRGKIWTAPHDMLSGLTSAAQASGRPVIWIDDEATLPAANAAATRAALEEHGVTAAAYWPERPFRLDVLRAWRAMMPLVMLDRRVPGLESHFVGQDDAGGAKLMSEHLISLGHRRIAFLATDPYLETVGARIRGYRDALSEAGIAPDADRILLCDNGSGLPPALLKCFLTGAAEPPTALMCANDILACQIIAFLRDLGIRVPDDIAVTGFSNMISPLLDTIGLTTVATPFEEMGRVAGEIMIGCLDGAIRDLRDVELPVSLIVRRSCGSTAAGGVTLESWER